MMWRKSRKYLVRRDRGVAALTVVMILFFVMALVAAYTNRNLIFEQRISANSYRSARALDASEAAIDWTLSMLNGGRIGSNCASSNNTVNDKDFRGNYLKFADIGDTENEGRYEMVWTGDTSKRMFPACISKDGVLNCICPILTSRTPTMVTPADGVGTAFNVLLRTPTNALQPGTLNIDALGCASIGTGAGACYNQTSQFEVVSDAKSGVRAGIGLIQALPKAPVATLTVGGNATAASWNATTPGSGSNVRLDIISGGLINPSLTYSASDPSLPGLVAANNWFRFRFGIASEIFKNQPAVITIDCAAGCNSTNLVDIRARFPRNPIWIEGDLTISSADQLGSMPNLPVPPALPDPEDLNPIMLLVNGTLTVAANVPIVGFIHANKIVWSAAGASLVGAMMTPGDFTATTSVTMSYNAKVLDVIRLYYGSFVRVPGSWKQLNTIS
jgi:hypothetical protein